MSGAELGRLTYKQYICNEGNRRVNMNRNNNLPSKDVIYISTCTSETIYGYVRAYRGPDVGFSVLDVATSSPNFSNCGVFWVKPEDFMKTFKYFMPKKLAPKLR